MLVIQMVEAPVKVLAKVEILLVDMVVVIPMKVVVMRTVLAKVGIQLLITIHGLFLLKLEPRHKHS
jgi:hypothetical protein